MESIPTRSSPNQDVNTAYLGFEGNLHDPEVIWGNMDIYSPAYDRMVKHLKIEDNLLAWDFKSAEELNVSQNIYDYLTFMWRLENKKLKTDTIYEIRKTVEEGIYFVARKDTPENIGVRIYK